MKSRIKPDTIEFIRKNFGRARLGAYSIACELKEKGFYSDTIYVKDIERTVKKVVKMIEAEPPNSQGKIEGVQVCAPHPSAELYRGE